MQRNLSKRHLVFTSKIVYELDFGRMCIYILYAVFLTIVSAKLEVTISM